MRGFVPGNDPLAFPAGTIVAFNKPGSTWAMYTNRRLNATWIAYAVPGGSQIMKLPGVKTNLSPDFGQIRAYVKQRQAVACGECGG
jgi:hypothetical protein